MAAVVLVGSGMAENLPSIQLLPPSSERGGNLMQAFKNRSSVREYAAVDLSLQDLSDLLWAANGINRAETGKLTAPTAQNKQEISLYVLKQEGAYRYDALQNQLIPVAEGDLRPAAAGRQDFAKSAPIVLLIVGNYLVFPAGRNLAPIDAGYVSQNIYLFCSGNGLGTVARATMDKEALIKALQLPTGHQPILNHPVGKLK